MKTRYQLLAIMLVCALLCNAQSSNYEVNLPNIPHLSPEAASLGKYGDIPVSEYTGLPEINIPLYTIKSGELELPISLSYHASGIKVNQEATWVGLGWDLMAGGCISMYVSGKLGSYPLSSMRFFSKYFSDYNLNDYSSPLIYSRYFSLSERPYRESDFLNEHDLEQHKYEPDIYQANFCGHTVTFFLQATSNNRIEAVQIGKIDNNYKIEFQASGNASNVSSFAITDNMGVRYEFGQGGTEGFDNRVGVTERYVRSWFLTKIKHPTKGEITFNYGGECSIYPIADAMHYKTTLYATNEYAGQHGDPTGHNYWEPGFTGSSCFPNDDNHYIIDLNELTREKNSLCDTEHLFKHYLSSISTDSETITFLLGSRQDIEGNSRKIESIRVFNKQNSQLKNITFDYSYFVSSGTDDTYYSHRLRLDGIHINDEDYNFTYTNIALPKKGSFAQDFWGYYNGKVNSSLIPKVYQEHSICGNADRSVDANLSKACMLERITYPTKGYTVFEFEPHKFDAYSGTGLVSGYGAGQRIKTISNYDNDNNLLQQTSYSYYGGKQLLPQNNIEEEKVAIYSSIGEYGYKRFRLFNRFTVYSSPRIPLFTSLLCSPVGYNAVSKTCGNIRTTTEFINFPASVESWNYHNRVNSYSACLNNQECPTFLYLNSGLKTLQTIYEINGADSICMKKSYYDYQTVENTPLWVNAYAKFFYYGSLEYDTNTDFFTSIPIYRVYAYPFLRSRIRLHFVEDVYGDDNSDSDLLSEITEYSYDGMGRVSTQSKSTCFPNVYRTISYTYPSSSSEMSQRNMLSYPIEITDARGSQILNRSKNNYAFVNNRLCLLSKEWAQGNNEYSTRISYLYDDYGNITQATTYDGTVISYLWAYNRTLPVAKIEGITYDAIRQLLGDDILDNLAISYSPSNLLSNIRTTLDSQSCMLSTYLFKPLFGVTEERQPNNSKISYTYDTYGRLYTVKDNDGIVTKRYQYNYAR